ncbi:N-6 DNA methylase [Streptomyces sp. NPDC015171]|uniref:N-6 DNA methylase n=1 Tax=Streptomyces sp. NPDC015171 TaxID=3364945 RepID=UPI0036FF7C27
MENVDAGRPATEVVERLWRAYAPFQRGRSTDRDLTAMLAMLALAKFMDSARDPAEELTKRWSRAVAEARTGYLPLRDLHHAYSLATSHAQFPLVASWDTENVFATAVDTDDLPWTPAFLTALQEFPPATQAGFEEVTDLLLERFVTESASQTGEFYTPRAVTRLVVESLSPQPGDRVLDPACGTGGFLTAAAQYVAERGHAGGVSLEGYAMDHRNPQPAMLNLALHGINQPLVRASDPASLFRDPGVGRAEFVMCNPPFNQRVQGLEHLNWPFGIPLESNANFAWLQFAWTRLSNKGKAGIIMPTGAASTRGHGTEMRRAILAAHALLGVVALPAGMFSHTAVPVHIWLLARDATHHLPAGEAGSVLFIDASRSGTQTPRGARVVGTAEIDRISATFRTWLRSPHANSDAPGFSRSVSYDEILANDGCPFDPRLYVEPTQERPAAALGVRRLLDDLAQRASSAAVSTTSLGRSFDHSERAARSEADVPRESLRNLLASTPGEGVDARHQLLAGPSGSLIRADDYVDIGGVPVVMPKDLTGGGFSTASIRHISELQAKRLERFRLRPGDVVLARRGELGRAAVIRDGQRGWVCGTGCFLLRPPAELDPGYFAAYLRSPEARAWLEAHSTGSMKMKTISLDVLSDLPVPVPALSAQRAIADAMERLDEYERLLGEQLALTRRIRHTALDGGIVPAP